MHLQPTADSRFFVNRVLDLKLALLAELRKIVVIAAGGVVSHESHHFFTFHCACGWLKCGCWAAKFEKRDSRTWVRFE